MFDPNRDADTGNRRYYGRLAIVAAAGLVIALSLWPSVTGFTVGADDTRACVAVRDAFRPKDATADVDCGSASRHRLVLTGGALAGLALAGAVVTERRNLRRLGVTPTLWGRRFEGETTSVKS